MSHIQGARLATLMYSLVRGLGLNFVEGNNGSLIYRLLFVHFPYGPLFELWYIELDLIVVDT